MVLTKTRGSLESRPRDNLLRLRPVGSHERRRHLDGQRSQGREGRRAGDKRAAPDANNSVQTNFSAAIPPLNDAPSPTATTRVKPATAATTTTTTVASKPSVTAARRGGLERVLFVNPDAVQARAHRRIELDASRSRAASSVPRGGDSNTAQQDRHLKEIQRGERVLRNRQSAALSRKRHTSRVGELEGQVEALKKENRRLRVHAAHLERGSIGDSSRVNPPSVPTTTVQLPRARVPGSTAPACLSTAPVTFPPTSSSVDDKEARGRQAVGKIIIVPPPAAPAVVEKALIGGGTGMGSAATAVACGVQQQAQQQQQQQQPAEVWTHYEAMSVYFDNNDFCSESSDAEDTIDRLFVTLMAHEAAAAAAASGREE